MARVYSTVLDGKPLGPHVKLQGSDEWLETGGKPLPIFAGSSMVQVLMSALVNVLLGLLISPVIITHMLPGLVSRQRAHTWFGSRERVNVVPGLVSRQRAHSRREKVVFQCGVVKFVRDLSLSPSFQKGS